ncbi:MAG TPA: SDR family oxidoreductase [Frankiaceae bacterium]|jgi:NAD(P)-dependent dehydrogenase (short-subunit alcohol dehydrogenase family)|nr:SDR family oxidoreductase [Frankiaceae bacterium]
MTASVLAGLRALVIGGSAGIGLASARSLAGDGAQVTIASRSRSGLHETAEGLAAQGLPVETVVCDAYRAADVAAAVARAGRDGGLDICVVIPGGGSIKPVLLYADDEFEATVNRNVRPVFLAVKYAGRAMVRAGGGSIVAISSSAARFSTRYVSAYAAGKAAVDQLVSVAADELGAYGVRVNSVRPGLTRSRIAEASFENAGYMAHFLQGQPIARGGEVTDIAGAVRYLAGPESSWVTGQHLSVDGGHTLRGFVDYAKIMDLPDQRQIALQHDGGADSAAIVG